MREFVEALVNLAEKGAEIARVARAHCASMTEEKTGAEANPRFKKDFKTLADVLVQVTIKHNLSKQFPCLTDYILGEETNTFKNAEGELVSIEIKEKESDTRDLLFSILNNNCAEELARVVYKKVKEADLSAFPSVYPELDLNDVGIWIDPIDCTHQFIVGDWPEEKEKPGYEKFKGLHCVTVLIGAFLRSTGEPIVGVLNQPFFRRDKTNCVWGVCYQDFCCSNVGAQAPPNGNLMISNAESSLLPYRLTSAGFMTRSLPGVGFKMLTAIMGRSDGYVLSMDTSFFWDTCAPHAILRALGGDVVTHALPHLPLRYNEEHFNHDEEGSRCFANYGGVIAYRHPETLERVKKALSAI